MLPAVDAPEIAGRQITNWAFGPERWRDITRAGTAYGLPRAVGGYATGVGVWCSIRRGCLTPNTGMGFYR